MNSLVRNNEVRVEAVPELEVAAFWRTPSWSLGKPVVDLVQPLNGLFAHNVLNDDKKRVEAGFLRVDPRARGNNIGELLVRGLGALSKKHGYDEIYVCLASQYSFDIFSKIFGNDAMTVYGSDDGPVHLPSVISRDREVEELDIGADRVMDKLKYLEKVEVDPELRLWGFPVTVDISEVDMTDWGAPLTVN